MLKGSSSSSKKSSSKSSGVRLSGSYGGSSSSKNSGSSSGIRLSGNSSSSRGNASSSGSLNGSRGASSSSSKNSGSSGLKLSGSYGGSSSGGFSTPVPSGAKKVTAGGGSVSTGSGTSNRYTTNSSVLGAYTAKGASNTGSQIPRYELPGFTGISTPNSTGLIKGWNGGKLENGVIKYPTSAKVDPDKAARAQAFVDYSYGSSTSGNSKMGAIYGQAYYDELQRLANLPVGAPAWGSQPSSGSSVQSRPGEVPGGSGGAWGGSIGGSGGSGNGGFNNQEYEDALRAAEEAAAEALKKQIEQGVNDIYAQKEPLEEQLRKSAQQMYIANMQGKKALPQQLAAQGLTGGATESANLALETSFGEGLNGLLEYYNQAIAQLNRDAENLRASGNLQQAQNTADFAKQLAQYAYETQQRLLEVQAQKELSAFDAGLDYDKWYRQQNAMR